MEYGITHPAPPRLYTAIRCILKVKDPVRVHLTLTHSHTHTLTHSLTHTHTHSLTKSDTHVHT